MYTRIENMLNWKNCDLSKYDKLGEDVAGENQQMADGEWRLYSCNIKWIDNVETQEKWKFDAQNVT